MVTNMLREGVSSIIEKRFLKASNTYLDKFDLNKEIYWVLVDANILYAGIMENFFYR